MLILTFGSVEVILPSPELGNTDTSSGTIIKKLSRGGERILFAAPYWPKQREVELEFKTLTKADIGNLEQFMKLSLGQEISISDHEEIEHSGIITTVFEYQENRDCDYSTT